MRLWLKLRGELRPLRPLIPLPLLGRQVEFAWIGFSSAGLKDVCELIENIVHLGIQLHNFVVRLCLFQRGTLVLLHHLLKEGGILSVDDVEHELTIALSHGVVREVVLQIGMLSNHLGNPLLRSVPVSRDVDRVDLERMEDPLVALQYLDHELGRAHALDGQIQLAYTRKTRER